MRSAARTPEELDTLLEDAFVVRNRAAVVDLFESDGLVAARAMDTRKERRSDGSSPTCGRRT